MIRRAVVDEPSSLGARIAALVFCVAGWTACGGMEDPMRGAQPEAPRLNASPSDATTLGFESTSAWSLSSGTLALSAVRTQGAASIAITNPSNETDLVSATVSSSAAALSGALDPGATIAVDVLVPAALGNTNNAGSLQLFASCPSRGVKQALLGAVAFTGTRLGIFQTVRFAVGDRLRSALAAGPCGDLSFDFKLHAPGQVAGTYLFDNLRVHSPSVPPAQAAGSVDLIAKLSYSPAASTPGSAHFSLALVQIPQSFHVKLGNAGSGTASLELGFGSAVFASCTYTGAQGGTFYVFTSCTGLLQPGDIIPADFARLTILSGDSGAGLTKVAAQLARNPVGDTAGAGVIAPMPTWWGDTPDQANQIVTSYFQTVNAAPKTDERYISTPVPDFARRHGDGMPYDTASGPPPPNDPPFHKSGHLNPGSHTWDAWWQLDGNLSGNSTSSGSTTTHFDATLGAHALVWGADIDIADAVATLDSGPQSGGSLDLYLFSLKLPLGGSVDASLPLSYDLKFDDNFDLPAIHIWIFSITIGLNAGVSLSATGTVSPTYIDIAVAPGGHVGAHLEGDIDIYIASGGVSARIDLISVSLPITAYASWGISTTPADCAAHFNVQLDGQLKFASGGGEVDLVAKFGICPFCDHESWPIFSWGPLASSTSNLFHFPATITSIPLDNALCFLPLTVSIGSPVDGATVQAGLAVQAGAVAIRPGTPGNPAQNLPCSTLTWTASPGASFSAGAAGCSPFITFPAAGNYTVTAHAVDSYGETGSASVGVSVTPAPAGFNAYISPGPPPGYTYVPILAKQSTTFVGSVTGGVPPYFYNWQVLDLSNVQSGGQSGSDTYSTQDTFVLAADTNPQGLHIDFIAGDSSTPSQTAKATVLIGSLVN